MNYRLAIIALLILAAAFGGGYFAGSQSQGKRNAALVSELEELRDLQRCIIEQDTGWSWEALKKKDPITRKHMIISLWYGGQEGGNYLIGLDSGHKWGPRWNRRSPLSILHEQTDVMRKYLDDLRNLEEASPYPPTSPTESNVDPSDGARIDWENNLKSGDEQDSPTIWFGKNARNGQWMAFEHEKGVFEPSPELLSKIIDIKRREAEQALDDSFGRAE